MKPSLHASSFLNQLAILAIRSYQLTVAPILRRRGRRCLHYPTCSEYGVLAYEDYDAFRATLLTLRRILDCHPYSGRPYVDFPP